MTEPPAKTSAYDAPSEVREVDYLNLSRPHAPVIPPPDSPAAKGARYTLAALGGAAFVFALVCAASIKLNAMRGATSGDVWAILIVAVAAAVLLWLAAASHRVQPSIDAAADKALNVAASTLRRARSATGLSAEKAKKVADEIDRRSKL